MLGLAWGRYQLWTLTVAILGLFIVYQHIYLTYSPVPGNSAQYPLGWWGWIDQGLYLKSAKAFASFDLSSDAHFYPPLYPFLGGIFLPLSEMHPFYLLDLALTCGFFF